MSQMASSERECANLLMRLACLLHVQLLLVRRQVTRDTRLASSARGCFGTSFEKKIKRIWSKLLKN